MMDKAKVFWSGRSQAVRLPKQFRFEAQEVSIRRDGRRVILEPLPEDWNWLDQLAQALDDDFVDAMLEESGEQERPALDGLFV